MQPNESPVHPYEQQALAYHDAGWSPLPVRGKHPPPPRWTGHLAPHPNYGDVLAWTEDQGALNIGLRLPGGVLGIDVDDYDDKHGGRTLAECEALWGQLPPTWRSTSRDDGVSGIRLFRVPPGLSWPGQLPGGDVELIHEGHRYAMVWPSRHPEGRIYRWLDPGGVTSVRLPKVEDLADLPARWLEELSRGDHRDQPRGPSDLGWFDDVAAGPPCSEVASAVIRMNRAMGQGSRHEAMRDGVLALVRLADEGHAGVVEALTTARDSFLGQVTRGQGARTDGAALSEWQRMLVGALALVTGSPAYRAAMDPCILPTSGNHGTGRKAQGGGAGVSPDDWQWFWDTEELTLVHDWARHLRAGPLASLVVTLLRVLGTIPPWVTLPPLVGGRGSLNSFVGLVSPSGVGKEAVFSASMAAVNLGPAPGYIVHDPDDDEWPPRITPGSGEGIAHMFARMAPELIPGQVDSKGNPATTGRTVVEQYRTSVLFEVDEVETLTALAGRAGSTLDGVIRSLFTAARLGHGFVDKEKRLRVRAHSYRAGLVVAIQPGTAAALFDKAAGGTPQRFLFVNAGDPDAPDVRPPAPTTSLDLGPLDWGRHPIELPVPKVVANEVDAARLPYLRGDPGVDALAAHQTFVREKFAQAVAGLHSRRHQDEDDWRRAGMLVRASTSVVAGVSAYRKREARDRNTSAGRADAQRKAAEREVTEETGREAVARLLGAHLDKVKPGEALVRSRLFSDRFKRFGRAAFTEAWDENVRTGRIVPAEGGGKSFTRGPK